MAKAIKFILRDSNPRLIKDERFEKLQQSIKEFPEMLILRPIIVNKKMEVLGGNMRVRACRAVGIKDKDIPYQMTDLTPEQEQEFIIKDNVGFGDWDWDKLANDWDNQQLQEWGMEVWNFDEEQEDDEQAESEPTEAYVGYKEDLQAYEDSAKTPTKMKKLTPAGKFAEDSKGKSIYYIKV